MKPLSDKFANLGRSGITRRVAPKVEVSEPLKTQKDLAKALNVPEKTLRKSVAVAKSRAKSSRYRDYQRDYMRKWRAKLSTP